MTADRRRTAGALLSLTVLLSGCASMPDDGAVTHVGSSPRAEGESRVRVFGVSPHKGASPREIVRGFVEATTSDEPTFQTARKYLTKETAEGWDPFAGTTVVAGGPSPESSQKDEGGEGRTVEVSGTRTARVDGTNAFTPDEGEYSVDFHLTKLKKGWRIDRLPDGLILGESDFERIYRSVNTFYFARLGPDAASVSGGRSVLVADPVYLRGRIDPVTETVRSLLDGPTGRLDPVVSTAFPEGTRLARRQHLSLDDSGALSVRLNRKGASAGQEACFRMAAQVFHSVQSQASAKVDSVRLSGPGGKQMCTLSRERAETYAPGKLNGRGLRQYFINEDQRVAAITATAQHPKMVEGALGSEALRLRSVGVSRDERQAAGVTPDGRALYVAALSAGDDLGAPAVTARAPGGAETGLSTPSWDGLGDLWVVDRDPRDPRLLLLRGGQEEPEEVPVQGLSDGESVESLRISSDGVRIALRVRQPDGDSTLLLGRVERDGTRDDPAVRVTSPRAVTPQLEDVEAVSWAGPSQLVVVGRESRGVQQLQYVGTDGSTTNHPTLPGINDVHDVAGSEDEGKPLLAESPYGIVRLTPDGTWKTLTEGGSAPVYPG